MPYVPALLHALVTLNGDAVVLHPGDQPYVDSSRGPVVLSSRPLTPSGFTALLTELLPPETLAVFESSGSVQWERPAAEGSFDERFVVVAARVGRELWMEVRRYRNNPPPAVAPGKPRGPDEDGLHVSSADEFWPARGHEDVDDSF